jgi:hypothetical protein
MRYFSNSLCVILYDYSLMVCNGSNADTDKGTRQGEMSKSLSLSHVRHFGLLPPSPNPHTKQQQQQQQQQQQIPSPRHV